MRGPGQKNETGSDICKSLIDIISHRPRRSCWHCWMRLMCGEYNFVTDFKSTHSTDDGDVGCCVVSSVNVFNATEFCHFIAIDRRNRKKMCFIRSSFFRPSLLFFVCALHISRLMEIITTSDLHFILHSFFFWLIQRVVCAPTCHSSWLNKPYFFALELSYHIVVARSLLHVRKAP